MRTVAVLLALALAGCASGGPPRLTERQRAFLGEAAEPSQVIATDLAFARAARENGQWTAFRSFAGEGAVIHQDGVPTPAAAWLSRQRDPKSPLQWTPTALWSSCDGQTTVTHGTSRYPDGSWGRYVTVWERQRDRSHRWVYTIGAADPALTERQRQRAEPVTQEDGVILVRAFDDIRAEVGQCGKRDSRPVHQAPILPEGVRSATRYAADGTLAWRWEYQVGGARRVVVDMLRDGAWAEALAFEVSPANQVVP